MTRTKLEIFCLSTFLPVYDFANIKAAPLSPSPWLRSYRLMLRLFSFRFSFMTLNVVESVFVVGRQGLYLLVSWITTR